MQNILRLAFYFFMHLPNIRPWKSIWSQVRHIEDSHTCFWMEHSISHCVLLLVLNPQIDYLWNYQCSITELKSSIDLLLSIHQCLVSIAVWFGVIFIRHGLYQDGVFKFTVYIPDNYPDGDCPVSIVYNFHTFFCWYLWCTMTKVLLCSFCPWLAVMAPHISLQFVCCCFFFLICTLIYSHCWRYTHHELELFEMLDH